MSQNPTQTLETILESQVVNIDDLAEEFIKPLTIVKYALLDAVDSPVLTGQKFTYLNLIQTAYIMQLTPKQASKYHSLSLLNKLAEDAYEWASGISFDVFIELIKKIQQKMELLSEIAPENISDDKKKLSAIGQTAG